MTSGISFGIPSLYFDVCIAESSTSIGGGSNRGRRGQRGGGRGSTKGGDRQDIPLPLDPKTLVLGLRPATAYT